MLRNFATTTEVCGRPEFLNEVLSLHAPESCHDHGGLWPSGIPQ